MTFSFEAIGTHWTVDIPESSPVALKQEIIDYIDRYDKIYSRFRTDSTVWKLSQLGGTLPLDNQGKHLFSFYKTLYDVTDGLVTPLIGDTLAQAGYDHRYSFQPKALHSPPQWEDVLEMGEAYVSLKQPLLLDTGAAGKGQLIDAVSVLLEQQGVTNYIVDAGGDMRHHGHEPARIGLEHPFDTASVIGVAYIENKSICGSAGNRRRWGSYHHVLDPKRLISVDSVLATWVIADSTMIADGISTALFFTEPEKLSSHFDFEYIILYPDYSVKYSKNFSGELF